MRVFHVFKIVQMLPNRAKHQKLFRFLKRSEFSEEKLVALKKGTAVEKSQLINCDFVR